MPGCVLVVDDDALIRKVSERSLTRAGFQVIVASSAAQAHELASAHSFDAAILDYFLGPGECGVDLIAPLRSSNAVIRIAILSGLGVLPDLLRHAHAAGADVVASKASVDWIALARGDSAIPPGPIRPTVDLAAIKRDAIHGAYLVHRRNISSTARALGMKRSNLQRVLRKTPPPALNEGE